MLESVFAAEVPKPYTWDSAQVLRLLASLRFRV